MFYWNTRKLQVFWTHEKSYQQEAAYSEFSLACLKIRSKNEEAINSTRNETDLLAECFYFLLYRRRYFLLVSELI